MGWWREERKRGETEVSILEQYLIGKKSGQYGSNCDIFVGESDRRSPFFFFFESVITPRKV